jgi:NAD(P)H-hydrate repair Nnr-like enzyme with NAD(P)H-hydrate epimerase domain
VPYSGIGKSERTYFQALNEMDGTHLTSEKGSPEGEERLLFTKTGSQVPVITPACHTQFFHDLETIYEVSPLQYCEAAAYSLAIAMRHALGSYAARSRVVAMIDNSRAGLVAAFGLRQLINAGASGVVFIFESDQPLSPLHTNAVRSLTAMQVPNIKVHSAFTTMQQHFLAEAHVVLCGMTHTLLSNIPPTLFDAINDATTPVHCVEMPPGVDPATGTTKTPRLYAASTLSLGLPLSGTYRAREAIGRHYLADVSFPHEFYTRVGKTDEPLFSVQPVIQLLWDKE